MTTSSRPRLSALAALAALALLLAPAAPAHAALIPTGHQALAEASGADAAPHAPWPAMAAAALHYTGLLLFTGLLCFKAAIARGDWPPRPRHRLLRASGAAAIAAAALAVPLGALDAAGLAPTRIADTAAWRDLVRPEPVLVAALTVLGVTAAYWCFTRTAARWFRPAALASASLALAAPVLTGHTRSFEPGWLMAAADLVHLLAGAVWVGGLAGLLVLLRAAHAERPAVDAATAARVVARFSSWAGATVAALGASGLVMALVIHRSWSGLLGSDHGVALLAKLDLVAVALALAAWNRYLLVPAVRRSPGERAGLRRLRRVLLAEAAAVALAAAVTGALVNLSPAAPASIGDHTSIEHHMATAPAHVD